MTSVRTDHRSGAASRTRGLISGGAANTSPPGSRLRSTSRRMFPRRNSSSHAAVHGRSFAPGESARTASTHTQPARVGSSSSTSFRSTPRSSSGVAGCIRRSDFVSCPQQPLDPLAQHDHAAGRGREDEPQPERVHQIDL